MSDIEQFSKKGTYHLAGQGENQDVVCFGQNKDFSVISLADGVSACPRSRCGAQIASQAITDLLLQKGGHFLAFDSRKTADFALSHILCELKQRAGKDAQDITDYSSTIASVLFAKKLGRLLCFNLGDSIIMGLGGGRCRVLALPADSRAGCCVTTTRNASAMASVKQFNIGLFESILICSDGAWKQMYSKNELKPRVLDLLVNNEFAGLKDFLSQQDSFDDSSFIALALRPDKRRKSA